MSTLSEYHIESLSLTDISKIPVVQKLAALDLSNSHYPRVVVEAVLISRQLCGGEKA